METKKEGLREFFFAASSLPRLSGFALMFGGQAIRSVGSNIEVGARIALRSTMEKSGIDISQARLVTNETWLDEIGAVAAIVGFLLFVFGPSRKHRTSAESEIA